MPYMNKRQLYEFEKRAFEYGLLFGYGVEHTLINDFEKLAWQVHKGEITWDEYEEKCNKYYEEQQNYSN